MEVDVVVEEEARASKFLLRPEISVA